MSHWTAPSAAGGSGPSFGDAGLVASSLFNDKIFSYQGPWESHGLSMDWFHQSVNTDLCKYGLDTADVTFSKITIGHSHPHPHVVMF